MATQLKSFLCNVELLTWLCIYFFVNNSKAELMNILHLYDIVQVLYIVGSFVETCYINTYTIASNISVEVTFIILELL